MNFPLSHPNWMWLYFGTFGTTGTIIFILVVWNWIKFHANVKGNRRLAAKWSIFGYAFLFIASWFACGIGGPPGNMLSSDLAVHNITGATGAATLSMFFSVPGWVCIFMGQKMMTREVMSDKEKQIDVEE